MLELKIHDQESAPKESLDKLDAAEKQYGYIPNFIGLIAESPATLSAYAKLNKLFEQTSFDEREQQVVLLTTSVTNDCHYCIPAHTAAAIKADLDEESIRAIRLEKAIPDAKLESLRQFTSELVRNRGTVSNESLKSFLDNGYTRKHAMEVTVGVSLKVVSNYVNHLFQTPLDEALEKHAK